MIPSNRKINAQLLIGRSDGLTWVNLSDYLSRAEINLGDVESVGTGDSGVDGRVRQLDFTLRNDAQNRFSPRDRNSAWNQFGGSYSPLLWPNREVMLRTKVESPADYTVLAEPSFSRSSVAYKQDGSQVAAGVPRFEDGKFGKAIMVEEGTTNLVPSANQKFVGWTATGGSVITLTQNQAVLEWGATDATRIQATGGTGATKMYLGIVGGVDGESRNASVWVKNIGSTVARIACGGVSGNIMVNPGESKRLSWGGVATGTNRQFQIGSAVSGETLDIVAWRPQLEIKSYSTSFTDSSRAAEVQTVPAAGTLSATQGTIEQWVFVDSRIKRKITGQFPAAFAVKAPTGAAVRLALYHMDAASEWRLLTRDDANTPLYANCSDSYTPDGWHLFTVRWASAGVDLLIDGIPRIHLASTRLATAFGDLLVGDWPAGGGVIGCGNALHDDLRASSVSRSDAETLAAYQSGAPLAPDQYTTLKLSFDGYLFKPWQTVFHGFLGDSIKTGGSTINCSCRDLAKRLQDCYIDSSTIYGSDEGTPAETVIQQIVRDNLKDTAPSLLCPVSPGFMVIPYTLEYKSVWDAIQEIVAQFGWWLGYKLNPVSREYELTLMEPPRTKTVPDFVLDYEDDFYAEDLDLQDTDIRNSIKVTYRNKSAGQRETVIAEDTDSIVEYGRRAMHIEEADASLIDTQAEAQALANVALADLKDLFAATLIEIPFMPEMDVFTTIAVHDPRMSSTDDFFGVHSVRHTLEWPNGDGQDAKFRTEVGATGRVIGGHTKWLRMETRPGANNPLSPADMPTGAAPSAPQIVSVSQTIRGVQVDLTRPPELTWDGFEVYMDPVSGFTPSSSNLKARGKATRFIVTELSTDTPYYIKVINYDLMGNRSPEVDYGSAVLPGKIISEDIDATATVEGNLAYVMAGMVSSGTRVSLPWPTNRKPAVSVVPTEIQTFETTKSGFDQRVKMFATQPSWEPLTNTWDFLVYGMTVVPSDPISLGSSTGSNPRVSGDSPAGTTGLQLVLTLARTWIDSWHITVKVEYKKVSDADWTYLKTIATYWWRDQWGFGVYDLTETLIEGLTPDSYQVKLTISGIDLSDIRSEVFAMTDQIIYNGQVAYVATA